MKSFARLSQQTDRIACADKAKGSIVDNLLSSSQLIDIQDAFVPAVNSTASTRSTSLTADLGHRLAFMLSYSGALRCETTRNLELSDLSVVTAEKEGRTGCVLLVLSLGQGKTNQFGRIDRTAIMRHIRPEMCAQGALAVYFFVASTCGVGNSRLLRGVRIGFSRRSFSQ